MTPDQAEALEVARALVRAGIPVFVAPPDDNATSGFRLPQKWETSRPLLEVVDRWRPGWALCAVMGHGLDLLDVDPRNGGDKTRQALVEAGMWPKAYGVADTPSGGTHEFVASIGTGSRDNVRPGFDVKSGDADGDGRGFAFIAPTERASKVTGEIRSYRWRRPPDLDALADGGDDTGAGIAELVRAAKAPKATVTGDPFVVADGEKHWPHTGPIADGARYPALRSYAGSLRRRDVHLDEALVLLRQRWQDCAQRPHARYDMPWDDAEALLRDIYRRYPPDQVPAAIENSAEPGTRRLKLTRASQIQIRPVRWLMRDRLPLGTFALLAGREGIGKSTLCYAIAADVTRGRLPGEHEGQPRSVIVAATEDSWAHTIVPRLMAADADLDRVYRVDVETAEGVATALSLPRDLSALRRQVVDTDTALVLLDPLMSRLDAKLDTHKDAEVRLALEPLAELADATNAGILGLIHVNKSHSTDPLNLIMGSKAFASVARAVLFVMTDPDDDTIRMVGQPKNNLGRTDLPTLTFRIESAVVAHTDDGPVSTGRVHWIGEVDRSIRDVLESSAEGAEARSATAEASDWLWDYLLEHGREADSADIKRDGGKAGHSYSTLKRARQRKRIVAESLGFPRRTIWRLPASGTNHSGTNPGESGLTGLTGLTEAPVGSTGPVGSVRPSPARGGPTVGTEPLCGLCGQPLDDPWAATHPDCPVLAGLDPTLVEHRQAAS